MMIGGRRTTQCLFECVSVLSAHHVIKYWIYCCAEVVQRTTQWIKPLVYCFEGLPMSVHVQQSLSVKWSPADEESYHYRTFQMKKRLIIIIQEDVYWHLLSVRWKKSFQYIHFHVVFSSRIRSQSTRKKSPWKKDPRKKISWKKTLDKKSSEKWSPIKRSPEKSSLEKQSLWKKIPGNKVPGKMVPGKMGPEKTVSRKKFPGKTIIMKKDPVK